MFSWCCTNNESNVHEIEYTKPSSNKKRKNLKSPEKVRMIYPNLDTAE